jgi:hypothetical protein
MQAEVRGDWRSLSGFSETCQASAEAASFSREEVFLSLLEPFN